MLCVVCCLGCPVIEYMAVFSGPLSMLQPSSTVDDLSVYGDKRFQFPFSAAPGRQWILWRRLWRRWRRRRNFFRGRGWAGRVKMLAGVESKVIQFIDGVAPRRKQIWRFHSCSSWNMFDLEAAGGEHRQGRRRSCDRAEASFLFLRGCTSTRSSMRQWSCRDVLCMRRYEGFWKNFSIFYVRCRPLWKSETLFLRALVLAVLPADSCDSPRKLVGEFHLVFLLFLKKKSSRPSRRQKTQKKNRRTIPF